MRTKIAKCFLVSLVMLLPVVTYTIIDKITSPNCHFHLHKKNLNFLELLKHEKLISINERSFEAADRSLRTKRIKYFRDLDQNSNNKEFKIPPIVHTIWLTPKHNPKEVSQKYIDNLKHNMSIFAQDGRKWKFVLWTNDESLLPNTVNQLRRAGFIIKDIKSITSQEPALEKIIYRAIDKELFATSSDSLRYLIMAKYGGVYTDVDIKLYVPLTKLTKTYDFIAAVSFITINNGFFAAKPKHAVINEVIRLVNRNFKLTNDSLAPAYLNYCCDLATFELYAVGPYAFSIAFYNAAHLDGNKDIVFDQGDFFSHHTYKTKHIPVASDYNSNTMPVFASQSFSNSWITKDHYNSYPSRKNKTPLNQQKYVYDLLKTDNNFTRTKENLTFQSN